MTASEIGVTKGFARFAPRAMALIIAAAAAAAGAGSGPASAAIKHTVHRYGTEAKAQKHCPKDAVVYGLRKDGRYYEKGDGHYGHIKNAVYVCRHEADRGGWHPAQPS